MVREDIFEGLKSGLARGKSLQESMQSFYNSGYDKKEIEEAAKLLLSKKTMPQQTVVQPNQLGVQGPQEIYVSPVQNKAAQVQKLTQTAQPISYYNTQPQEVKKSTGLGLIIFLIIFLVLLFGALIIVFLFKESITAFFQ